MNSISRLKVLLMKKRFSTVTVLTLLIVGILIGIGIDQLISGDAVSEQIAKLREIWSFTQGYYVEEVDLQMLTEAAIVGMLDKLDPYSAYYPTKTFARVKEEFEGKFEGIGVSFRVLNDTIIVVDVIGGGPSARIGILSNDRIVKINDSSSIGFADEMVLKKLRGPKGTKVKVSIRRQGFEDLLDFEIIRDVIPLYSVDVATLVGNDIGYISLNKFAERTHDEMETALEKLTQQGMKKLILDLRANPGGYLEEAVQMADLFLDDGDSRQPRKIVYTKGRKSELDEEFFARSGDKYEKIPLIILISNYSASASEIVAGAIQDWDRGLIVGETSFGKGLVQRQWRLSDGTALRLTVSRYYTPSGRLIQRPYAGKNRVELRSEALQRQEKEGENFEHQNDVSDSTRPVYHTYSGRKVFGGGGISPDYIVKNTTLTAQTINFRRRDLYYQYIVHFLDGPWLRYRNNFGKDIKKYLNSFEISESIISDFHQFIQVKGVKVNEEEFNRDLDYTKASLKAYIARSIWGNEGWYSVMLEIDDQFKTALTLFPEAMRIAKLK